MTAIVMAYLASNGFTDVDPGYIRDWLIVLACFVALGLGIALVIEKIRGKSSTDTNISPQPLTIRQDEKLATKTEVRDMGAKLEKDIDELREAIGEERRQSKDAITRVHERLDKVVATGSEAVGKLDLLLERLEVRKN